MLCQISRRSSCVGSPRSQRLKQTTVTGAVQPTRRQFGAQLLTIGVGLLSSAGASLAAEKDSAGTSSSSSSSSSTAQAPSSISIAPINSSAKSYMDMRDDAMEYQCTGGMFDCDGDRRDFAHKQWMDWLESGGTPKRIRDGKPEGPRSF
uniref:Uncharacterized protein n=1 Tax=Tetradesmus obliquus TaxID=3088 RepID=A0A383VGB7_TETOB|eukprot:jgi/Sobl393_1/18642/SZX64241.1